MKKILCIITLYLSALSYSQNTDRAPITSHPLVVFQYDSAGNQIVRSLCVNCPNGNTSSRISDNVAEPEDIIEKFFPGDVLSYYPNPVKEQLFIKWESSKESSVRKIYIFNMGGQLLKTYTGLTNSNTASFSFQEYPAGVYNVVLDYSNGEQKSIKVIKQ